MRKPITYKSLRANSEKLHKSYKSYKLQKFLFLEHYKLKSKSYINIIVPKYQFYLTIPNSSIKDISKLSIYFILPFFFIKFVVY